jgi:DNA-binding GntR family transcriptional regulator
MKLTGKERDDGGNGAEPRTMDDDPVVQGILKAIVQKRLRPGLKLGEADLASAFGTTRIHVRQVLAHLVTRRIVTHYPNRGAFIRRPSVEEARDIFDARRILEAATVSAVIDRLDRAAIKRLKQHIAREAEHNHHDRWDSLSLTADFHVLIAELAGNAIATFEVPGTPDCSPDAHPGIAELILARDKDGALAAMRRHIDEIEARLHLGRGGRDPDDIAAIFQEIGVAPVRRGAV